MIFGKHKAQMEELKKDNAMLQLLIHAYMRRNRELENDIALLNASLDVLADDKEKWKKIAKKADERRREYVRNHNQCAD